MHHLKAPYQFASPRLQGHHRVGVPIVACSQTTVKVGRRAPGWDIDQPTRGIHRESGPGVARSGSWRGFRGPWNGIPTPAQTAGAGIESPHNATLQVDSAVVSDG